MGSVKESLQDLPSRPSSSGQQFPNRWATLPQISSGSPIPGGNNQMVPYNGSDRPLEGRLAVAEKSNRALLDEVVRLQADAKGQSRRMEGMLQEEQGYRKQLENSLRASNDIIAQLSNRLQRAEERMRDEHSTLSALVSQTKGMESAIMGNQKEMLNRKDVQATRIQELRTQLDESHRAKDQLERTTYQLVDEMRQLKAKVDAQGMDFSQATNELKNSTRRLEDETKQTMTTMAKTGENNNTAQFASHQLRSQLESRLSELREVIVELRKKQEVESQERRTLEQRMQLRLGEMNSSVSEQVRRRDEVMHALEQQNREKDHMSESEKMRLQSKISEVNDEVQRKMSQKEMKIKEDMQRSISNLENLLRQEQEDRTKFERSIRDALDERFESLQRVHEDSKQGQLNAAKQEKKKQNETLHKLNDGLQLLEKEIQEYRKRQETVLAAEVSSRKQHEKNTKGQMRSLEEKITVAIATMQQAISGLTLQMATQKETLLEELKGLVEEGSGSSTRGLADMDSRLLSINQRLTHAEEMLEAKIQAVSEDKESVVIQEQNVREKVETLVLWQQMAQKDLEELQEDNVKAYTELDNLKAEHTLFRTELRARINTEVEPRVKALEAKIANRQPPKDGDPEIPADELENLQSGIRKLAESIQTVKTVLGMKIQSEQKLRVEQTKKLQDDVEKLTAMVEPLLKNLPEPGIYIKPEDYKEKPNKEVEEEASEVNKWNIYNTYRWLMIKEGILKLKKEGENKDDDKRKDKDDDDKKKDKDDDDDEDDKKKKKKDDDDDDDDEEDKKKKKKKDEDDD